MITRVAVSTVAAAVVLLGGWWVLPFAAGSTAPVIEISSDDHRVITPYRRARVDGPEDPWTDPLPSASLLDERSDIVAAHLVEQTPAANLYRYGVAIYSANEDTPRHEVECTAGWGRCALEDLAVPIPDGAVPAPGSDGAMVVVDQTTGTSYEFWQARRQGDRWVTTWGGVVALSAIASPMRTPLDLPTGAGISRLAGVVRESEIADGVIPHALVFSTDNACAVVFRPPARKTDGRSSEPDCIPEGARVQLDPAIDLDALDLTPAERTVGEALQRYGAYAIDNGGHPMSLIFEHTPASSPVYLAAGLTRDYQKLDGLPWDRLRVLATFDGS